MDEVKTSVDPVINDLLPVDTVFLLQIRIEAGLDAVHDRLPAIPQL